MNNVELAVAFSQLRNAMKKLELRIVALEVDVEEIKRREKDEVAYKLADAQARLAMLKQELKTKKPLGQPIPRGKITETIAGRVVKPTVPSQAG